MRWLFYLVYLRIGRTCCCVFGLGFWISCSFGGGSLSVDVDDVFGVYVGADTAVCVGSSVGIITEGGVGGGSIVSVMDSSSGGVSLSTVVIESFIGLEI